MIFINSGIAFIKWHFCRVIGLFLNAGLARYPEKGRPVTALHTGCPENARHGVLSGKRGESIGCRGLCPLCLEYSHLTGKGRAKQGSEQGSKLNYSN